MRTAILLLGLGNPDRRDDGVGSRVVRDLADGLASDASAGTEYRDVARLMEAWAGFSGLVVVDAALGGGLAPGAARTIDPDREPLPRTPRDPSGHALGLAAALELSAVLGERPQAIRIVAVGAADLGWGAGLSAPVEEALATIRAAVADALAAVRREIEAEATGPPPPRAP